MNDDITGILADWEFNSENQIRIIKANDGRDVLQVRQPLGIEQYEMDGRPDGKRPFDRETILEEYQERLEKHISNHATDKGFKLKHEDCLLLQNEGILFYYRYLVLFQIGDFTRTARDTEHNLCLCDLVEKYSEAEDDKKELLQYRPYIVRMLAVSRAMISLHQQLKNAARDILKSAIEEIEGLENIDTPAFQFERIRSLNYLRATLKQLDEQKISPLEYLRVELENAVREENYERAAVLRDRIKEMGKDFEA